MKLKIKGNKKSIGEKQAKARKRVMDLFITKIINRKIRAANKKICLDAVAAKEKQFVIDGIDARKFQGIYFT